MLWPCSRTTALAARLIPEHLRAPPLWKLVIKCWKWYHSWKIFSSSSKVQTFPPTAQTQSHGPLHCSQRAHQLPALQDAKQGESEWRYKGNGWCTPCAPSPAWTCQTRRGETFPPTHPPTDMPFGYQGRIRRKAALGPTLLASLLRWHFRLLSAMTGGFPHTSAKVVFAKAAFLSLAFKSRSYQGINHPVTCCEACEKR